jgi:perosamine synthetase
MSKQMISWWRTEYSEEEERLLHEAFNRRKISYGEYGAKLEERLKEFLDVPFAMMTSSGSASLYIACMMAGVRPGDEVIVPDRTFHATAHAAQMAGAKVRLVDCDKDSPRTNAEDIERKVNSKTKAIFITHLNGRSSNAIQIKDIAKKHGVPLLEDTAQGFGSTEQDSFLGTIGDVGCFSMGMTKFLSTGQGGFVTTHDPDKAAIMRNFISHGVKNTLKDDYHNFGFNFRLTDLQSALGLAQLSRFEEKVEKHNRVHDYYKQGFKDNNINFLNLIPIHQTQGEVPLWVEVTIVNHRERFIAYLLERGIEARQFLPSLHLSEYLRETEISDLNNSLFFSENGLFLPAGPDQSLSNIDQVLEALKQYQSKFH